MLGSDIAVRVDSPPTANGQSHHPERFEVALTVVTLAITAVACALLAVESTAVLRKKAHRGDVAGAPRPDLFMSILALLLLGGPGCPITSPAVFLSQLEQ